jgi:hypothetical protein
MVGMIIMDEIVELMVDAGITYSQIYNLVEHDGNPRFVQ